jgi:hypothetical protein
MFPMIVGSQAGYTISGKMITSAYWDSLTGVCAGGAAAQIVYVDYEYAPGN